MNAPLILAALLDAQKQIGVVAKLQKNTAPGGGYNFRGIDAVVNAVSPAFHEAGIVVTHEVLDHAYRQQEVGGKRSWMQSVTVRVRYTFHHVEDGSMVSTVSLGEAADTGDKATPKAMSIALRTALLQTLMLPTDEPDPDSFTYGQEAAEAPPAVPAPSDGLVRELLGLAPGETPAARVAWLKDQAKAHGYDMMNGPQMVELLEELRAVHTTEPAR